MVADIWRSSMPDIVHALGISAGILLMVVVLTVIVSMLAVNRGAAEMESGHGQSAAEVPVVKESSGAAAVAAPAKVAKPAPAEEVSVIQILLFGTGLFVLTVIVLIAVSLIEHMG